MASNHNHERIIRGGIRTPVDVSKLTLPRLLAYRRVVQARAGAYEICDCRDMGCDFRLEQYNSDRNYIFYRLERARVNRELHRRQVAMLDAQKAKQWAHVPTVREEEKMFGKYRRR